MPRLPSLLFLLFALLLPSFAVAEEWPTLAKLPDKVEADGQKDAALIIGIEDYIFVPDVLGAKQNANDWYSYLVESRKIRGENVKILRNHQGSLEAMKKYAGEAASRVKRGGTLWIIYIGHGAPSEDGKDGVLVGVDSQQTPESLYARSLPQKELIQIVSKGKQAHTIMVIDACFSGKNTTGEMLAKDLQPLLLVKKTRPSVTILSAGKSDEFAGPLPGTPRPAFSYLILGAMRGWGDENADGSVTATEATNYARNVIVRVVEGRTQTPQLQGPDADFKLSRGAKESGPNITEMVLAGAGSTSPIARTTGTSPASSSHTTAVTLKSVSEDGAAFKSPKAKPPKAKSAIPKGMVKVPAGRFAMGSNKSSDEEPIHQVHLDAFAIDKTEVTVFAYKACVDAGQCSKADTGSDCNWGIFRRGNHPVNCVDWRQSVDFCRWKGKRLPTEAEWEKAARGTKRQMFPWRSGSASCSNAVMDEGGDGCGKGRTWPVGSKPSGASPYGAQDMAGNVKEWTADWYDRSYYSSSPFRNPKGPLRGSSRVRRGGSWDDHNNDLRAPNRHSRKPSNSNDEVGFRCAKSLKP